jgi:hypothetical protein
MTRHIVQYRALVLCTEERDEGFSAYWYSQAMCCGKFDAVLRAGLEPWGNCFVPTSRIDVITLAKTIIDEQYATHATQLLRSLTMEPS